MDDQTLLDALNDLILKRIRGDAYIEYSSATMRFRGETLESLMRIRDTLRQSVAAQSGGNFGLFSPLMED